MSGPNCSVCRFWRPTTASQSKGECRRFPAAVVVINDEDGVPTQTRDLWPIVTAEEWCGECQGRN